MKGKKRSHLQVNARNRLLTINFMNFTLFISCFSPLQDWSMAIFYLEWLWETVWTTINRNSHCCALSAILRPPAWLIASSFSLNLSEEFVCNCIQCSWKIRCTNLDIKSLVLMTPEIHGTLLCESKEGNLFYAVKNEHLINEQSC